MIDGLINEVQLQVLLLVNRPTTVCRDVHRRPYRSREVVVLDQQRRLPPVVHVEQPLVQEVLDDGMLFIASSTAPCDVRGRRRLSSPGGCDDRHSSSRTRSGESTAAPSCRRRASAGPAMSSAAVLLAAGTVAVSRMTGGSSSMEESLAVQVCSVMYTTVYLGAPPPLIPLSSSSLRCTVRLAGQPCSALCVHR
jgi:hypothetical protein